jgi:UDP-N-acetylmuramoyl-L-alanyl-D-glutamate--2,6-diaminopimelate ligase
MVLVIGKRSIDISSVTTDSRTVRKGGLFIAVKGYDIDGHRFIPDAIASGARVIICEDDFDCPEGVAKILVKDSRVAVPGIAADFYGHPSRKLKMIGVTGTNGKTTITYLIESIVKAEGRTAGVIGTINYRIKGKVIPAKNTTPGPMDLQAMLAEMVKRRVRYAVVEVSSHSLDQRRVDCLEFDTGVFTNLTSEHLDYHKTVNNYFKAKASLFGKLKKRGFAVLNNDDARVARLAGKIKNRIITYGIKRKSDVSADDIRISIGGSRFIADTPKGKIGIDTGLIGMHNISNILASIAAAMGLGIKLGAIKKGVEALECVPGRLEHVNSGRGFKIFVDYAHTEDALLNVLRVVRQVARKNIITVFGCGGNRDRSKRPAMGKVCCRLSDRVIVTSDNPRFEDPLRIIGEIESGIKDAFSNYEIEPDRHSAIERALKIASEGDIVILAGKGHEDYQIVKGKALPFDDRVVVREILKK